MTDILAAIDEEISQLQRARALLAGLTTTEKRGPGRPKGQTAAKPRKKRTLSPEGRARIVAALKARWAAKKN